MYKHTVALIANSTPRFTTIAFLCACSSADADTAEPIECISPGDEGVMFNPVARTYDLVCPLTEFPFVQNAEAVSVRGSTVGVEQPRGGSLCLSGAASETAPSWGVILLHLSVLSDDGTEILSTFDAGSLGVTQLRFTLDSPPSSGLMLDATSIRSFSCPGDPSACVSPVPGFALLSSPGSSTPMVITSAGRVAAPLANFQRSNDISGTFNPNAINFLAFKSTGTYDFCISDLEFLDANGNVVRPQS
jgi:hypothetical protein